MSLGNLVDKAVYQGNGSNLNFVIPFAVLVSDTAEVGVILRDETVPTAIVNTLLTYGALQNYTLTGSSPPTTPFNTTVALNVAPTATQYIIVYRILPLTQLLTLLTGGTYDFSNITLALDRLCAMIQMANEGLSRTFQIPQGTRKSNLNLTDPPANSVVGFDASGNPTYFGSGVVLTPPPVQATSTGGAPIAWTEDSTSSPIAKPTIDQNNLCYAYSKGVTQSIYSLVKIPNGYVGGNQIKLRLNFYSPDSSGTVLMQSLATLIRPSQDAISTSANQRTSTNAAATLSAGTVSIPQALTLDLTDSTGKINGVSVAANQLIKIKLSRGTDTGSSDVNIPVYGSEVTFT